VVEGTLVIAVLAVTVMSSRLPSSLIFERVTPGGLLIVIFWVVGIGMLSKARTELPWLEKGEAPGGQQAPRGTARARKERDARNKGIGGTLWLLAVFALASVVTLVAGVALERSGEVIAGRIGMDGVLFGSTVLAAATALPEVSTGLASARLGTISWPSVKSSGATPSCRCCSFRRGSSLAKPFSLNSRDAAVHRHVREVQADNPVVGFKRHLSQLVHRPQLGPLVASVPQRGGRARPVGDPLVGAAEHQDLLHQLLEEHPLSGMRGRWHPSGWLVRLSGIRAENCCQMGSMR